MPGKHPKGRKRSPIESVSLEIVRLDLDRENTVHLDLLLAPESMREPPSLAISRKLLHEIFSGAGEADETIVQSSTHPRPWTATFLAACAQAMLEVAASLDDTRPLDAITANNTLAFLGEEISRTTRRHLLLATLDVTEWNLTHAAERLRMSGPASVIREIKKLGLDAEYDHARRSLRVRGGPKDRAEIEHDTARIQARTKR
jgi:hypothetical protein